MKRNMSAISPSVKGFFPGGNPSKTVRWTLESLGGLDTGNIPWVRNLLEVEHKFIFSRTQRSKDCQRLAALVVLSAGDLQTGHPCNEPEVLGENGTFGSTGRDDWKDM